MFHIRSCSNVFDQSPGAVPRPGVWTGHLVTTHKSALFDLPVCTHKAISNFMECQRQEAASQMAQCHAMLACNAVLHTCHDVVGCIFRKRQKQHLS